jgi:hypothetical protein
MRSLEPFWTVIFPVPDQLPLKWANGFSAALDAPGANARRLRVVTTTADVRAFMDRPNTWLSARLSASATFPLKD